MHKSRKLSPQKKKKQKSGGSISGEDKVLPEMFPSLRIPKEEEKTVCSMMDVLVYLIPIHPAVLIVGQHKIPSDDPSKSCR